MTNFSSFDASSLGLIYSANLTTHIPTFLWSLKFPYVPPCLLSPTLPPLWTLFLLVQHIERVFYLVCILNWTSFAWLQKSQNGQHPKTVAVLHLPLLQKKNTKNIEKRRNNGAMILIRSLVIKLLFHAKWTCYYFWLVPDCTSVSIITMKHLFWPWSMLLHSITSTIFYPRSSPYNKLVHWASFLQMSELKST